MNYLDIIIGIPLFFAAYKGFTKGFIITLASLLALIAGIYGAIHFSIIIDEYLNPLLNLKPEYENLIFFAITFLAIVLIVNLIAYFLDKLIKATGLGIINRLAGVIFNLLKIALILSVIMNMFNYAGFIKPIIPEKDKQESVLYEPVSKIAPAIFPYLNFKDIKDRFKNKDDPGQKLITQNFIR